MVVQEPGYEIVWELPAGELDLKYLWTKIIKLKLVS